MKILLVILSLLLFSLPSFGQTSERPEGIVIPVATLGDVTETRRQIIQNTLIESLSSYYRLVPQDKLEEVQEKIFQEMDYEECTEDQCIVMIQEALQVENLFVLQVIGEGQNTQMSLKWVGLDDKKIKTDVCKGCDTFELNERVEGLVKNLESVIPRGFVVAKRDDDEELRRQKEEELRKQREAEEKRKREDELRKQQEERRKKREEELSRKKQEEEDEETQRILNSLYENRKFNLLGMYVSSFINVKNEPKKVSRYISYLSYDGFGIGLNYYLLDNYHLSTNISVGYLTRIEKTTPDNSTSYSYLEIENETDPSSVDFFDMSGENTFFNISFNRNWLYKKWNFWVGGGLYSESGSGTIITTNEIITTSFSSSGPLFSGGFDYNFENGINVSMNLIGGLYFSPITQEVNKEVYETDVNSSMKYNFGLGYNL